MMITLFLFFKSNRAPSVWLPRLAMASPPACGCGSIILADGLVEGRIAYARQLVHPLPQ